MPERASREITQRELRNDSGAIMRGVERGEPCPVTRNGTPTGRLIPIRRRALVLRAEVVAAFATTPVLDPATFRADLDEAMRQEPSDREW
ncbi:type II toxin-antitoxin system Phd/YefM family antitoxin [Micromonospora sp. NPDC001898]|uniref:type II toxin-antitoxin system Phd/YefM family antitoxin n=1 Tax=Micromonospora sp. NPDC001898 TaxID=3364221 RepID=UPI0036C9B53C